MRIAASVCQVLAEIWLPRGLRILRSLSRRGDAGAFMAAAPSGSGGERLVYTTLDARSRSPEGLPAGEAVAAAGMHEARPRHHLARAPGPALKHQAGLVGPQIEQLLQPAVRQDRLHRMLHRIGRAQRHEIFVRRRCGEILLQIGGGEARAYQPVLELDGLAVLAMKQKAVEQPGAGLEAKGGCRLAIRLLRRQQQYIGAVLAAAPGDFLGDVADLEQSGFGLGPGDEAAGAADAA